MMRTHYCGSLTESQLEQTVTICGWVHRRRDHGGVIFLDMRDRDGLVQVVIDPDTPEAFATADRARSEYVLKITGRIRKRYAGTENANMTSGQIELLAKEIETLASAETPPFPLNDESVKISEEENPELLKSAANAGVRVIFADEFKELLVSIGQSFLGLERS